MKAVKVRVTGRVQGVGFRAWTQDEARRLGLAGWVRNKSDGAVVALLAGPDEAVERMLAALRDGPDYARVDALTLKEAQPPDEPGFWIRG